MKNMFVMTLKFWGSGMASIVVLTVLVFPLSFIDQDNMAIYALVLILGFGVLAPIVVGATQHWFWKDHDWHGGSQ